MSRGIKLCCSEKGLQYEMSLIPFPGRAFFVPISFPSLVLATASYLLCTRTIVLHVTVYLGAKVIKRNCSTRILLKCVTSCLSFVKHYLNYLFALNYLLLHFLYLLYDPLGRKVRGKELSKWRVKEVFLKIGA